jgi:hypothetical protein
VFQAEGAPYTPDYSDVATLIAETVSGELAQIQEANARLIAAAPELLAILLDVQKRIKEGDEWWIGVKERGGFDEKMIDAVIAKATGEPK